MPLETAPEQGDRAPLAQEAGAEQLQHAVALPMGPRRIGRDRAAPRVPPSTDRAWISRGTRWTSTPSRVRSAVRRPPCRARRTTLESVFGEAAQAIQRGEPRPAGAKDTQGRQHQIGLGAYRRDGQKRPRYD
jgi:hypothetical protein